MNPRARIGLALSVGVLGSLVGISNQPVDAIATYQTPLGERTQPYWLVPDNATITSTSVGAGLVRLIGALIGVGGFIGAMHLAGEDMKLQPRLQSHESAIRDIADQTELARQKIWGMAELQKTQMLAQSDLDFHEAQLQATMHQQFQDAFVLAPDPEQPKLPGTSLDEINNPSDKVGGRQEQQQPQIPPQQGQFDWTKDLMGYPSILIYGAQGSGKTSTSAWLIRERIKRGHNIIILDPHREHGQWNGLECVGDGMDYEAINERLKWFTAEIKQRYKLRSQVAGYNPQPITLICDEFTQWAGKCPNAATFFEECLTDIRKIKLHVLFISHARTLKGLGGASGMADARDAGLLELELEAQVDPVSGEATPKLQGWLKYPAMPVNQRVKVQIAPWMNGNSDFTQEAKEAVDRQLEQRKKLEDYFRMESFPNLKGGMEAIGQPPNPSDELSDEPDLSDNASDEVSVSNDKGVSDFVTVRWVQEMFPNSSPEQLWLSVSDGASQGMKARDIIRQILKCREGSDHPTRSYSRHGKPLLKWLIANYDDGKIAQILGKF